MSTTSNPVRNDLPSMIYAFGGPGSSASTTATANISAPPLAVRLLWTHVPTLAQFTNGIDDFIRS